MEKIKFLSIIKNHDLFEGLIKDGLLISLEKGNKNKSFLYIIGLEISYDTIDFHDYNKFIVFPFSDQLVHDIYNLLFDNKSTKFTGNNLDILCLKIQKIFEFRNLDRYEIFKLIGIDLSTKKNLITTREYIDNLIER